MARQEELPHRQTTTVYSSQPYDNALKGLMGDHAAEIIPEFIPEATVVSERNNEIKQENLRADLVYFVSYENELQVLNMELQTNSDNARKYIEKQAVYMYTFLPCMKGVDVALLKEAIDGMKQHYTEDQLARHLARFRTILHRSTLLSETDKQLVEDYMEVYDSLLDNDPYIQEKLAKKAYEGELRALRRVVLEAVADQYPALVEQARESVVQVEKPEILRLLVKQIYKAPDEKTAQFLLETLAA